jgi:hypothetical protein
VTNREKVAYLAGLVDGEGCFRLVSAGTKGALCPSLAIRITNKEICEWLQQEFGGSLANCAPSNARCAPSYLWQLKEKAVFTLLLPELLNFLKIKKMHAIILLEFCRRFPRVADGARRRGYTEEVYAEMQQYTAIFNALNSLGPDSVELKARLASVAA